jgi:hypothetical protein
MSDPTITFVTAFIELNEDRTKDRTPETRIALFRNIANSGIAICLYVSSKYEQIGKDLEIEYNNIKLMPIINLEDTETYKLITSFNPYLPINRLEYKDTVNYMIVQNAKSELVYNTTLSNPFNTEHFAWIDFSIFHMVNNIDYVMDKLNRIKTQKFLGTLLLFPSCWSKEKSNQFIFNSYNIYTTINWRFCGSFFIGDKKSLQNMHLLCMNQIPNFIHNTDPTEAKEATKATEKSTENIDNTIYNNNLKIIAWEINIWAWLEVKCNWNVDSYQADHNNSILDIPTHFFEAENAIENAIENTIEHISRSNIHKYVDKVIYINLEHRKDRKIEIETELNNMNIEYERFNAISTPDFGIVGCTQSHLEIFKMAKEKGYKNILIFEDDFKFIVSKIIFEEQIELLFNSNVSFDICMLGYRLLSTQECLEFPFLKKAINVDTTSAYIINESMYDTLIELNSWTLTLLIDTQKHWIYALDQIWKLLQPISKWYCFNTRIGIQRPSYSDLRKQWDTPDY